MAKRFGGFTPDQLGKIDPSLQGLQSDEQQKIIAANPALASRIGALGAAAEKRIRAAGSPKGFASGGWVWAGSGEDKYKVAAPGYKAVTKTVGGGEDRQTVTEYVPIAGYAEQQAAEQQAAEQRAAEQRAAQEKLLNEQYTTLENYKTDLNNYYDTISQGGTATRPTAPDFYNVEENIVQKNNPYEETITKRVGSPEDNEYRTVTNPKWQAWEDQFNATDQGKLYNKIKELGLEDVQRKADVGEVQGGASTEQLSLEEARAAVQQSQSKLQNLRTQMSQLDPEADKDRYELFQEAIAKEEANLGLMSERLGTALEQDKLLTVPNTYEILGDAITDPMSLVTEQGVEKIATSPDQMLSEDTGQLTGDVTATATTAAAPTDVTAPEAKAAPTVDAVTVESEVQDTVDKLTAATGKPSAEALADAQTMDPEQLAQLGLTAAQIDEAVRVEAPQARTLQEGELISGSAVDQGRVEQAINFEAATGSPSTEATVQGQLTGLMEQFEGGATPAWAAGAMRAAAAQMAARGLSASSMAGMATVQAAMESAMPIAQADAATVARFEQQNLSNRQQATMFAAEQRANFLNMEFTQEFQTRVANASKITEIANANYAADVQIALENSRNAQSVDLANLNAKNAKILSDAAAMTNLDMANLSNNQQAAVVNAKAFLEMDMANLSNEQQTEMFKTQSVVNALFSDQAAENAAAQFNASSELQVDQFYDNLTATVSMFNTEQKSVIDRFNAGETNAIAEFNATVKNMREQFNATNSLVVEQANAKWLQEVSTLDTAAQNLANRDAAMAATGLTSSAFNALLQEARDIMSFAWQTEDNNANRATQLAIAKISSDDAKAAAAAKRSSGFFGALGNFAASVGAAYVKAKIK